MGAMETVKHISRKVYEHSFVRYVAIGGTTFMLDFLILVLLHGVLGVNLLVAATISYWSSIIFNFVANRVWTFGATETHIAKHAVAYGILLGFNYVFTLAFVGIASHMGMHYTIAKVFAVAIQIPWTYIAYKKVIFR
jgi:putative flippase GtrA